MLILNVDDDVDDRDMFQAAINAIDPKIDCLQFETGSKVLEYVSHAEVSPDFLFIDINMPKMNGYECVERISQIKGTSNTLVVMFSTAFDPKQQNNFREPGIRYLKKASKFSELVQSIKKILLEDSKVSAEKLQR